MKKFIKLWNNVLSPRAFFVFSPSLYFRYLENLFANISSIIGSGDLRPLDKAMGVYANKFNYRGASFVFDCEFCDEHLDEDSFAFGVAREIYIRDCYFKWLPSTIYDNARIVVDLGANRGAFSALMTTRADFILSVECGEQYAPIIEHNLKCNNFSNYAIETAFIGEGGDFDSNTISLTINDLFKRHKIESVDLMKLDIEGSEFSLFASADWLEHVNAISMEVHPHHGRPSTILRSLSENGFSCVIADENLQRLNDPEQANFI